MKIQFFFFAAILIGLMSSCSPKFVPVTSQLIKDYDLESHFKDIDVYTSGEIVFTDDTTSRKVVVKNGIIYDQTGEKVKQVVIEKHTVGQILFSPKPDRLGVTFEPGGESNLALGKFSMFGEDPKLDNFYAFLAQEWSIDQGKATYDKQTWLVDPDAASVFLLVDLRKIRDSKAEIKFLEGADSKHREKGEKEKKAKKVKY